MSVVAIPDINDPDGSCDLLGSHVPPEARHVIERRPRARKNATGATWGVQTSWAEAAKRAHGLLAQTLPDELMDEIVASKADAEAFALPPVLFG